MDFPAIKRFNYLITRALTNPFVPPTVTSKICYSRRTTILWNSSTTTLIGDPLPETARVSLIISNVTILFDGTGKSITFGTDATPNLLGTLTNSDLNSVDLYQLHPFEILIDPAGTQIKAFLTPGTASQGSVDVEIFYTL